MSNFHSSLISSESTQNDGQLINVQHTDLRQSPYSYHPILSSLQHAKMFLLSFILLPIRATMTGLTFLCALGLANFIISNEPEKPSKPQCSLRRRLLEPVFGALARIVYFCGGIHYVSVKGTRASREEAPILVLAPHSAFLDTLALVMMGLPSCVATTYHANSFIGGVIKIVQPILVHRENPDSRKITLNEIAKRVTSNENWPQLSLFPEGTCANRQCLIPFKQGAFRPGVPVQPVLLRYPNKVDTASWVADGPSAWSLLYMIFTQFYTRMEIEFLPVYTPNEEERADPQLYANNVRLVMAKALGIPICDLHYDDFGRMRLATELQVPDPEGLVCVHGLLQLMREAQTAKQVRGSDWIQSRLGELLCLSCQKPCISKEEFVRIVFGGSSLSDRAKVLVHLTMQHYPVSESNSDMNFRRFCVRGCMLLHATDPKRALEAAFKAFPLLKDPSDQPVIAEADAKALAHHAYNIELPVNDLPNGFTNPEQTRLPLSTGVSASELWNILSIKFPEAVSVYGRYRSGLSESLGRPFLDLNPNYPASHAPCDIDAPMISNSPPAVSSNGLHHRKKSARSPLA